MSPEDTEEEGDHAYFQAIEGIFVTLRGAPLLLSPADWHITRRWHQEGIPLDLVRRALEELFAKRKEPGTKRRLASLRYCARFVEAAWAERRELAAPGGRLEAPSFNVEDRLRALAAALPAGLSDRDSLAARLAGLSGDAQKVEEDLSRLDREILADAAAALDETGRGEVEAAVAKTLDRLRGRLPEEELERSRERLTHQILRRRLGLPVLSLFSPEAEAPG